MPFSADFLRGPAVGTVLLALAGAALPVQAEQAAPGRVTGSVSGVMRDDIHGAGAGADAGAGAGAAVARPSGQDALPSLQGASQPGRTDARALSHRYRLPVWELGLGLSAITLPDYRGSDRQRQYLLPFPVFVYRSPHLRVDRGGIRADLWDSDRYELDVSVAASPPVRRTTTGIRAGMPRLKPLFEIGPRLQVHLWRDAQAKQELRLELPLRYAMPSAEPGLGVQPQPELAGE